MKKKYGISLVITLMMSLMLLLPQMTVFAEDDAITEPDGTPIFELYGNQTYPVTAGEVSSIEVQIQNVSEVFARYMNTMLSDDQGIVQFKSDSIVESFGCSRRGILKVPYKVFVPAYVESGRYPLSVQLTHTNRDGMVSSQNFTIYLDVTNGTDGSGIKITDYTISKSEIATGDIFDVAVTLKNNCGVDVNNVTFALEGMDGMKFAVNNGLANQSFSIKKDETKTITFQLVACKGISSIREVINTTLTYRLDPGNKETEKQQEESITIPCKVSAINDPDAQTFAPNIIIDKYDFGGEYVVAGKTFPLSMTIRNTNSSTGIKNLKVTVIGAAGAGDNGVAFSPANSSNSFFFESLAPGASTDLNIDLLAKADAKPDSYPVNVVFDYEYTSGGKNSKAETITETLSIPLQQEDRFTVNPPEIEEASFVGQECMVNATFVNKGKSSVYNVTVDVEGEGFDKTTSSYYIGNVDSGKEEYYDTRIIPNTSGEIKGEIVVTYEDSNGNEKEIRKEFITNATEMQMMDPMVPGMDMDMPVMGGDMMPSEESAGLPTWAIIVICVAGAGVVVAAVIIIVKVVKKKKALKETEDDDEDN